MAFDSVQRGLGRAASPRARADRSASPRVRADPSPARKRTTTPMKKKKGPTASSLPPRMGWDQAVAQAEASVSNPPPREIGTTAEGQVWLAENATKPGVHSLPCGLQYMILAESKKEGARSPLLDTPVEVHFRGFLLDGTEFDSSYARGSSFTFKPADMCQAWTIAMQLMGEGDCWELYVPSELAYGDVGRSSEKRGQYIPGGAALVFMLSMIKVKGRGKLKPERPCVDGADHSSATHGSDTMAHEAISSARSTSVKAMAGEEEHKDEVAREEEKANSWMGGLFDALAMPSVKVAADERPAHKDDSALTSTLEGKRGTMEQAALEALEGMLLELKLPTLKQALTDLGMPTDGGKAALTHRLSQRLTSVSVASALTAAQQ